MRDLGSIIGINNRAVRADVAEGLALGTLDKRHATDLLIGLLPIEVGDDRRERHAAWYRAKAANRREVLKRRDQR